MHSRIGFSGLKSAQNGRRSVFHFPRINSKEELDFLWNYKLNSRTQHRRPQHRAEQIKETKGSSVSVLSAHVPTTLRGPVHLDDNSTAGDHSVCSTVCNHMLSRTRLEPTLLSIVCNTLYK